MGNLKNKRNFQMEYLTDKAAYDACLKDNAVVCIDFTATWCPPCKMIGPKFEAMEKDFPNVVMVKCDVDENAETSQHVGIQCMPTFKFFKNGEELKSEQIQGANEGKIKATLAKFN